MNDPLLTLLGRTSQAGGAFGAITAFIAYYVGTANLLAADGLMLPLGNLAKDN